MVRLRVRGREGRRKEGGGRWEGGGGRKEVQMEEMREGRRPGAREEGGSTVTGTVLAVRDNCENRVCLKNLYNSSWK